MARRILLLLGIALVAGCAGANPPKKDGAKEMAKREAAGEGPEKEAARAPASEDIKRKVIYTGRMELQVEDLSEALASIESLLKEVKGDKKAKGYTAKSDEYNSPGAPRRASLVVRVPAESLAAFRAGVAKLGEVQANSVDSEDVTDAYYDTKAEVTNLEELEKSHRALVERARTNPGTRTSDLLELQNALGRVRGEIDTRLGRMKRWERLSEMSTLTIELRERTSYVPDDAAPLGTRIGRAFLASVGALWAFLQGLLVVLAAVLPWVVALGGPVLLVVLVRRYFGGQALPPPPPACPKPPEDNGESPPTIVTN